MADYTIIEQPSSRDSGEEDLALLDDSIVNVAGGFSLTDAPSPDSVASEACAFVCSYADYLGPLLESALTNPSDDQRVAQILTRWGFSGTQRTLTELVCAPDAVRHEAYVASVLEPIKHAAPWLEHLFNAAGATLLIYPGEFSFTVPQRHGVAFRIPSLVAYTHLLPWAEPGEIMH